MGAAAILKRAIGALLIAAMIAFAPGASGQRIIDTIPSTPPVVGMIEAAGNVSPVASWDASTGTLTSLAALVTATRTSNAMMFDSTGKLTYAPSNILLNSATLSTQTVTVQSGVSYILSAKGIGVITLSGASTSVWTGTGASNRVDLKITASTSSLTLTVAGSVTAARLSAVTYETSFRSVDDVDTTSAAYYGPRIDYTYSSTPGLLVEGARTNLAINSTNFSGYAPTNLTRTTDSTLASDGVTSAAKMTASAGTVSPLFSSAAVLSITAGSNYALSIETDGRSGAYPMVAFASGPNNWIAAIFDITTASDGSATQTASTGGTVVSTAQKYLGSDRYRLTLVGSIASGATASLQIGLTKLTTGNTFGSWNTVTNSTFAGTEYVYFSFGQVELGSSATSYIPTAASSVTRAADALAAAAYSSNPAIIQYRDQATGTRARKVINPWSGISSETAERMEIAKIYPVGTPTTYLNAHLTVDGAW